MSGPIVRSGASPEFSKNWDSIFSGKKKSAAKPAANVGGKKSAKKKAAAKSKKPAGKGKKS